jgi:hypothetical protein
MRVVKLVRFVPLHYLRDFCNEQPHFIQITK